MGTCTLMLLLTLQGLTSRPPNLPSTGWAGAALSCGMVSQAKCCHRCHPGPMQQLLTLQQLQLLVVQALLLLV